MQNFCKMFNLFDEGLRLMFGLGLGRVGYVWGLRKCFFRGPLTNKNFLLQGGGEAQNIINCMKKENQEPTTGDYFHSKRNNCLYNQHFILITNFTLIAFMVFFFFFFCWLASKSQPD